MRYRKMGFVPSIRIFEWVKRWTELVSIHARMRPRLVIVRVESECLMILPLALRKRGPFTIAGWLVIATQIIIWVSMPDHFFRRSAPIVL